VKDTVGRPSFKVATRMALDAKAGAVLSRRPSIKGCVPHVIRAAATTSLLP
jgi:hypothetical protein